MDRGFARTDSDLLGVCIQMSCRPCQRPPAASGQRTDLAIERHNFQGDFLGVYRRAPGTWQISEVICLSTTANPSSNRVYGVVHEDPDSLVIHTRLGQSQHSLTRSTPFKHHCRRRFPKSLRGAFICMRGKPQSRLLREFALCALHRQLDVGFK